MSRIFDALQRSGTEQSGVEYPDMISMATAVFESDPSPPAGNMQPLGIQSVPELEPITRRSSRRTGEGRVSLVRSLGQPI